MISRIEVTAAIGLLVCAVVLLSTGCSDRGIKGPYPTGPAEELRIDEQRATVEIYKHDGSRQCMPGSAIPLEQMEQELTKAGIEVFSGRKDNDGLDHAAACGIGTGHVNVYEISAEHLEVALKLDFREFPPVRDSD